jgi:hypothetical protein
MIKKNTTTDIKHLVLNSDEEVYTVHIKDITYVNESFDGPKELKIDIEKSFVDEQSNGEFEMYLSVIEDVIYADLLENYNEEVVDFTIVTTE